MFPNFINGISSEVNLIALQVIELAYIEPINSSSVTIQDVALKTYQE